MAGRNTHRASKKDAGTQRKVGLGLCLAKFSKHGNLHADVLTETDGTHVEVARGVVTEHMLERNATQVPVCLSSPYTKKTDWCEVEGTEEPSRGTHPATTPQPAGRLTPNILFCCTSQAPQTRDGFQGCQNTKHPQVGS